MNGDRKLCHTFYLGKVGVFYAVLAPSFNSIRTSSLFVTVGKATFRPGVCIVVCWIGDNNDILTLGPCIYEVLNQ